MNAKLAVPEMKPEDVLVQPHAINNQANNICVVLTTREVDHPDCFKVLISVRPLREGETPDSPTPEGVTPLCVDYVVYREDPADFTKSTIINFAPEINEEIKRQIRMLEIEKYVFCYVTILVMVD